MVGRGRATRTLPHLLWSSGSSLGSRPGRFVSHRRWGAGPADLDDLFGPLLRSPTGRDGLVRAEDFDAATRPRSKLGPLADDTPAVRKHPVANRLGRRRVGMEDPHRQGQRDSAPQNLGVDAHLRRQDRAGSLTLDTPIPANGNPGVDDLQPSVLAEITDLRKLDDPADPPHAMFAVSVKLDPLPDRGRCHAAGRTLRRSHCIRRRGHCRIVSDPMLAPDLGADYIRFARPCDAVSSTTGSRWFARLLGFPSPIFFGPTARRCPPPYRIDLPSDPPPAEFSDRDVVRLRM